MTVKDRIVNDGDIWAWTARMTAVRPVRYGTKTAARRTGGEGHDAASGNHE